MTEAKKTELMEEETRATSLMPEANGSSITSVMDNNVSSARLTEIMDKDSNDRVTSIMQPHTAIDFSRRTSIDGFKIKKVIAENTGEATLILTEDEEGVNQVIKLYHSGARIDGKIEKVLENINSPYVMPYRKGGIYDGRMYEILPYYEKGDLTKNIPMSIDFIEKIVVKSLNEGLKVLHDNGIIHRDIKPSNLFLSDDESRVILGDFGISSLLDNNISVRATSISRTLGYSAPVASNGFVSRQSDYYSFGITLLHLVIGQDPFLGMTDMQILYQTINKPLEIPATVPPRMQQLIRGLTVKDRNNRWGYDEVVRWLNEEDVEIKERKTHKGIKPYTFNYNKYYGLDEISMAFANDWENATKHLYRGLVEKNIIQYGEEYVNKIADVKEFEDKDGAVFSMIYILNPHAPLCFKGKVYPDLQALGAAMKEKIPEIDPDIWKLISKGCLLQFIESNNFNDDLKAEIKFITEQIQKNKSEYYFALMYILYPEIGFDYNKKKYVNLEDFIDDLEMNDFNYIARICQDLISNPMFIMWIYSLGYAKQVESWMKIYEKAVWE